MGKGAPLCLNGALILLHLGPYSNGGTGNYFPMNLSHCPWRGTDHSQWRWNQGAGARNFFSHRSCGHPVRTHLHTANQSYMIWIWMTCVFGIRVRALALPKFPHPKSEIFKVKHAPSLLRKRTDFHNSFVPKCAFFCPLRGTVLYGRHKVGKWAPLCPNETFIPSL